LLTVAIELGIALLFGFRGKKQFRFILLVNAVTQIALNIALNIINYRFGQLAFIVLYIPLEIAVFIVEAFLYTWYLKKRSEKKVSSWKPCIYALAANTASFALGFLLSYWIPGIF
jgi:hydrogenase-4 membrane subunit HyfE